MAFIRKRKQGNRIYAHQVHSYRDPISKKVKQKTKYLGAADPITGNIIPANSRAKKEKTFFDFGDSFVLHHFLKNKGLYPIIYDIFKERTNSILALITYQILEGGPMKSAIHWFENSVSKILYNTAHLSSQNISKILEILGDKDLQFQFFQEYSKTFFSKTTSILMDSTSLGNSIRSSLNTWGMTPEGIKKNISCLMLVEKTSKLPIYFRCLPGSIPDVSLIKNTLGDIKKLNFKPDNVILDAGFFSTENVKHLSESKVPFVNRLPKNRNIFSQLLKKHKDSIQDCKNTIVYNKRALFIVENRINIEETSLYAYLILDPEKRGTDIKKHIFNSFKEEKSFAKESLEDKGFFVLISSNSMDKKEILPTYYSRQSIEEVFGICKSINNILPLRKHNDKTIRGFLMLSFFSLIAYIQIRRALDGLYTVNDALLILRGVKCKTDTSSGNLTVAECTKKQKNIFEKLKIEI